MQAPRGIAQLPDKLVPLTLSPQAYLQRMSALAATQAAWSPICTFADPDNTGVYWHQHFASILLTLSPETYALFRLPHRLLHL